MFALFSRILKLSGRYKSRIQGAFVCAFLESILSKMPIFLAFVVLSGFANKTITGQTCLYVGLGLAAIQLAGGQVRLFFAALHNLIGNRKGRVVRVVTILQRSGHKLNFVLVARDLRKETAARADNDNVDRAELLNRRVRQLCHCGYRVFGVALVVERHEVVQAFDLMAALRETRSANHHLLSRRNNFGI